MNYRRITLSFRTISMTLRMMYVRFAMIVGLLLVVLWCLQAWLPWHHITTLEDIQKMENLQQQQACHHPELDPNNPVIMKHVIDLGELECKRELDWLDTRKGYIHINPDIVKRHGKISCTITYLTRVDDFETSKDTTTVTFTSDAYKLLMEKDFFTAECQSRDGLTWRNVMAGIVRNETAVRQARRQKPQDSALKLNVLIFGLDSMSRLHYIRKMPNTYKYLTKILNATILKDYNIVGDGTPQALIPILTGSTEQELPETRKRMDDANYVNVYPFAWNNFSSNGYVTLFGEDTPTTGIFTYRLKGFDQLPTNHYMRPFYIEVEKHLRKHPKYCLGNTPKHKVMLNWVQQFFSVYHDVPRFAFVFHGELSHDDYNLVGYTDNDVESFLRDLHRDGILNETLLIFMSDHGHRFASIRETQQGKQEERLPFFAVAVPPWLEKRFPMLVRNLRTNGDRLATPFDIYSTLLTVLNPNVPKMGDITSRSISLFSEIPRDRTCSDADIEPHWCTCLSWATMLPTHPLTAVVSQAVIDYINKLTMEQRQLCAKLYLDRVTRMEKLQPNLALLKFRKNADRDGFVGDFSDDTRVTEVVYQIQFRTFPSQGLYEASVNHDVVKNVFYVRENEISRVNLYGNQEHCIHDRYPNLRKYCFCKVQL